MRSGDLPIGTALLGLALAVLWHVQDFPPAPGQPYGPALFPGLIAVGLALSSGLLIVSAWRARARPVSSVPVPGPWLAFGVTVGVLLAYVLIVDRLGFIPTAFLMLCALLAAYRVRRGLIIPVAAVATILVHAAFYKLLKVPLPWGILSGVTW